MDQRSIDLEVRRIGKQHYSKEHTSPLMTPRGTRFLEQLAHRANSISKMLDKMAEVYDKMMNQFQIHSNKVLEMEQGQQISLLNL